MRRTLALAALLGLAAVMVGVGYGAAQEANKTAPAVAPAAPSPPAPVVSSVPTTPAAKALANAVAPDEGTPPPKAETVKPVVKAEPAAPKAPAEPTKRTRYTAAVLQAVDKITAETLRFETKVGEPVRFKGLILTVRSCETTTPDETAPDNLAFLDVQSQPMASAGHASAAPRQVFRGWMFASSPGLHPFEHPIYDVWLIACKTAAPEAPPPIAPKSPTPPKALAKRPL